ncbi:MAG TPA: alpha/beta fold hydrolase [Nocardioidaceae bacterium]|nr:alpha/beta fold hydrolase [Nocardioidaceae bacterium]
MSLHVTRLGEGGSPVVFLHGLFGQGRNWTQIAKAIAENHRVTLVDLPHHGRSAWSHRFDFQEAAEQIAGLWTAEDAAAVVGHSLGGKVAMVLALQHPEQVERLCVADIAPVPYDTGREFVGYTQALKAVDLGALERRDDADRALEEAVPNPTVRSFLLSNLRRDGDHWRWQVNLDVIERDLEVISGWPADLVAQLPPYDGPVLWLAGERSDYVKDEYAPVMDQLFPRNRRVTIKNAGHWLHSEQPEVFTEVLKRFLG